MAEYNTYFCYEDEDGKPYCSSIGPKDFEKLPYSKAIKAPTLDIAKRVYEADLKIMKRRNHDRN